MKLCSCKIPVVYSYMQVVIFYSIQFVETCSTTHLIANIEIVISIVSIVLTHRIIFIFTSMLTELC